MSTGFETKWWRRDVHADRRALLVMRSRLKADIRAWFEEQGFIEIDAGCLQVSPGNECHLHAFKTEQVKTDLSRRELYLHTSPEFACKKLLAAGEERIFTFAHVFRNREDGPLHASEFNMLEWYRANKDYDVVIKDCLQLLRLAGSRSGGQRLTWRDRVCDLEEAAEVMSVADAFQCHAGIDLLCTLGRAADPGEPNRDLLAELATRAGIASSADDSWSDIFSRVLTSLVEPRLGIGRPTVLTEYPCVEAALARTCTHDPRVAERFEVYACGVELANGFGELTDADEQRRRFEAEMEKKERLYSERYPIDEDLLTALSHMPDASGVALGFDRLVMLAAGAQRIDQVIWTPLT